MRPSLVGVLALVSFTCGEKKNPAVQVILNERGLQYGKNVAAAWVQERLEQLTLPDISGTIDIIGAVDLHYTLTGLTVSKCDFPQPSVDFNQNPTGLNASLSGLSVALTGGWTARLGLLHDSGTLDIAIFTVDVTSLVELGKDPDGRLSVTSGPCQPEVGSVDMRFSGGASWIIQIFVDHFKGRIRGNIENKICTHVEESIVSLESHLLAMNVSFDVTEELSLDLPLTANPISDASSLMLGLKGQFYSIRSPSEPPFAAQPFSVPKQPDYMLSAGISEFTLNSASYGFFSDGLFQVLINDSMLPPHSPVHLNTSSMGPYIPQLPKMFPGLLMELMVFAREVPLFSFQPGAVKLGIQGAVKASAIQPNGTRTPLFTLNTDSKLDTKVWIKDGRLKAFVKMNNFTLTLASSEVGPFKTDALQNLARIGMTVVLGELNDQLGKGVELPRMKHAQLVDTVLEVSEGFIVMSSNVKVFTTD